MQWILTFKNKNNETLKRIAFNWCIGSFRLFGYYLEYITKKVPTHWNYKGEVDKWEINIH
jgi:hypothetical protein